MAESSLLWTTTAGLGDGTITGYTDAKLFELFRSFSRTVNLGGVFPDVSNELAVTGTATPVSVNTGQALCYGIPYFNTAAVTVAIATPGASTRVDRIVLRASWAAQTVRITRIAGTEGAGAPAMVQTPGTTWDVPLANVSITTGAVITVTDAREWVVGVGDGTIDSTKLAALSVTAGKIATDGVIAGNVADNAVDPRTDLSGTNGIVIDPQNGNARGTDAVDLQTIRATAAQVASGTASVIGGGSNNSASGINSTVGGGDTNVGNGANSTVSGGFNNAASGVTAVVGGGDTNIASGTYSTVSGGYKAVTNKYGQVSYAAGMFSAQGDAQRSAFVLRISTSNGTQTEIFLDGASARMTIASDTTWAFRAQIVARRTDADNESAAYEIAGCIDNNGGTTALVGTITKTVVAEDTAAWDVTAEADNTNDALVIKVTGEAAKTIRWVATVWTTEVTG